MEKQERKILIEVSQEEYEKIKAGILGEYIPTYEDVRKDVLEKLSDEDVRILMSNHYSLIMDNIDDEALVSQIIRRSQDTTPPEHIREAVTAEEYMFARGTLQISKINRALVDEPLEKTRDTLTWHLKSFDDWGRK